VYNVLCRRRHLKRRSQTTDPLYSASRFDDDETIDRQQLPDSVIYVPTCNQLKDTPTSLCSYHRYFRSRTGSGNDAMWRPDQTPIYVASTVADMDASQTSFPLLVHPASTLATPHFRSTAMTSPEVDRRPPTSFRSADNLDCAGTVAAGGDHSTSPRQAVGAGVVESVRRKRTLWTADGLEQPSETENLCSCEHPATVDCS